MRFFSDVIKKQSRGRFCAGNRVQAHERMGQEDSGGTRGEYKRGCRKSKSQMRNHQGKGRNCDECNEGPDRLVDGATGD